MALTVILTVTLTVTLTVALTVALTAARLRLQEVLNRAGAVLWLDGSRRLVPHNSARLLEKARQMGVLAWPLDLQLEDQLSAVPTTAFTHYKMFDYFDANIEHFYFHKMVSDE